MKRYFSYMFIYLLAGIIIGYYMDMSYWTSYVLIGLIIILSLTLGLMLKDYSLAAGGIFLLLGLVILSYSLEINLEAYINKPSEIIGRVERLEEAQDKTRLILRPLYINGDSLGKNTYLLLSGEGIKDLRPGYTIRINSQLKEASHFKNPRGFNYKNYLLSRKIYGSIYLKPGQIKVLDQELGLGYKLIYGFNKRVDQALSKNIDQENTKLLKTIILGENYLDMDLRTSYTDLGLAHILAVSGLHIGIISSFLLLGLSFIGISRKKARILTIVSIWAYAYLINFPVSIVRANLMISLYYISRILDQPYDYKNSIYFAGFILLLLNPLSILSTSFILSLASVLSLAYIEPAVKNFLQKYMDRPARLIAPILSVNLGLFPLLAYYFNGSQLLALPANILLVPLVSLALNLAIFSLLLNGSFYPLNKLIDLILTGQLGLVRILSQLPIKNISLPSPSLEIILSYYLVLFIILKGPRLRKALEKPTNLLVLNLGIYSIFACLGLVFYPKLQVDFLDVGQGDAILLRQGFNSYLIDSGGESFGDYSIGDNVLLSHLIKHNVTRLKGVFISHFHDDHARGLLSLLKELEIENIYCSYQPENSFIYEEILSQGYRPVKLKQGQRLVLAKDFYLDILSPESGRLDSNENNLSMVCKLYYRGQTILFTGDMEEKVEKDLLRANLITRVDVLKLGHHGSKTSSSKEFLDRLDPDLAVISLARNNQYGHPHKEVLDRLDQVKVLRTDKLGHIGLSLGQGKLIVKSYSQGFRLEILDLVYISLYGFGLGIYISRSILYYGFKDNMLLY